MCTTVTIFKEQFDGNTSLAATSLSRYTRNQSAYLFKQHILRICIFYFIRQNSYLNTLCIVVVKANGTRKRENLGRGIDGIKVI